MRDDKVLGSTVRLDLTTHDSTGALVAPSSAFAASDFRIYKDGSATEKVTTNGITVTSPFDSIVGKHLIEIDTGNSTGDVGFWASGSEYRVELNSAKTISSIVQSGVVVGRFALVVAGVLRPTVDGRTLVVSAGGAGDAALDTATQTQIDNIETFAMRVTTGLVQDGAVYQFTANMLELGPSGVSGTGARTVTITVNDGTTALQNATVRMTEGVNSYTALTDADGVAVFNLDDATYTVSITKSGYSYTGTTLVVNGTETATYSMTAISVTPPTSPSKSAIEVLCVDENVDAESGVAVDFRIVTIPTGDQNIAYKGTKQTATSDVDGIARFEVARGSVCEYKRGEADVWQRVTVDNDSVTNVTSFIGSP